MTLTLSRGPLSATPPETTNYRVEGPKHRLLFEDFPRRVRAVLGSETVLDTSRAKLLHESAHLPQLYVPLEDVREDLLEPTDHTTHCPFKGDAAYWSVRVGDRVAENAAWSYPRPLPGAPALEGFLAFTWGALDGWLEEDEPAPVHPRNPYTRVDVLRTSRHVRVSLHGEVLADTTRAMVLYETGLPPRWYIPVADVRTGRLAASDTVTHCPYKGQAAYRSVAGAPGGEDLVWVYDEPRPEVAQIEGLVCFLNERVDLEVDDEALARPRTRFS